MQDKTKNKIVAIGFLFVLIIFLIANIIKEDKTISFVERRKLAQFPKITLENITNGKVSKQLENYTVDQFVARDTFRNLKAFWNDYIFMQKDNNGLFLKDGSIYKIEYPINEANVQRSANKIKNVYEKYLEGKKIYYSIIPDKNYYLSDEYLKIDVSKMKNIMQKELENFEYIDLTESLNLQDYYNTDLHWKQEKLKKVVNTLQDKMNLKNYINASYQKEELGNFYGAYYGQLGKNILPDKLNILTNDTIESAVTYNYETQEQSKIYNKEIWKNLSDKYDVFLSGAVPIISIENVKAKDESKELILFRDSFGSSLAPLLLENYKKITLVDLRYVSSDILDRYIEFKNQDILFLYSTIVLNQNILR